MSKSEVTVAIKNNSMSLLITKAHVLCCLKNILSNIFLSYALIYIFSV